MKNQVQKIPLDSTDSFFQVLEDKGITEWFSQNGKKVLYALGAALLLLALLYQFSSKKTSDSEKDFLQASREYQGVLSNQEGALERLQEILVRRPEFEAIWGGAIAEHLIASNKVEEALPFAERALKRVSPNQLDNFSSYSRSTLLIAKGDLENALKQTLALKETMLKDLSEKSPSFNDTLFAYTLLRIASLERALNHPSEEKQAFQEWKKYAGFKGQKAAVSLPEPEAYAKVAADFSSGTLSLLNYIEEREKVLN